MLVHACLATIYYILRSHLLFNIVQIIRIYFPRERDTACFNQACQCLYSIFWTLAVLSFQLLNYKCRNYIDKKVNVVYAANILGASQNILNVHFSKYVLQNNFLEIPVRRLSNIEGHVEREPKMASLIDFCCDFERWYGEWRLGFENIAHNCGDMFAP